MKKELLWAACLSVVLGAGVLFLAGGNDPEGGPWKPLNDQLETALAVQERTIEVTAEAGEGDQVAKQESSENQANASAAAKAKDADNVGAAENDPSYNDSGTAGQRVEEGDKSSANTVPQAEVNVQAATEPIVSQPAAANSVAANGGQDATPAQSAASAAPVPINDGKIHINSADATMLMELPGIGEKKAQAILDYRTQNGPFQNVTDIVKVKGIGVKMLEKMLPDLAL